jgi:RHS repeat-associated protein
MRALILTLAMLLGAGSAAQAQTAQIEYYHLDAVGSVRAVTNQAGQVVRTHEYFPFGDGPDPLPASGQDALRFTGKERDAETGLHYFGARYYGARGGRFTTVDPVLDTDTASIDPQQWNRYAYARNNPLRYTDPDGREVWSPFQSAKPSDFSAAAGFLVGLAKGFGNLVIAANSPGHAPPERDPRRYYEPANTAEALGMVGGYVSPFVAPFARLGGSGARAEFTSTSDLVAAHGLRMSNRKFSALKQDIRQNGIRETVKYVEDGGVKHIVDGHHRVAAARSLNMPKVPTERVTLPFHGYKTRADLINVDRE